MKPLGDLEVWFLTGSQDLYGEETLRQVARDAQQIAAALDSSPAIPVRVVFKPVVKSAEGIAAAAMAASDAAACVGVIAWMHTFSPAQMWIAGLQVLRKPLLHLHTQFNRDLPWSTIDMDFMNLNQAAHGDREFGHMETRMGVARKTVAGHWQDPAVLERVGSWSRAACGWHDAHRLRVARFGDNMRDVAVTEGDKVEAQIRLGASISGFSVSELADAARAVPEADVDRLVEDYEANYLLAPRLRANGPDRPALREAARIEAALRGFLVEHGCDAFTDTFEDLDGLLQLPGIAVQRLMAEGYGFGAEGDWKTAVMVRVLKTMARGLPGGTSFMEDYTYHLDPAGPKVLGAHMLEVCPSISDGRVSCEIHPLSIGARSDPVRLVFDAGAGPAIIVSLTDMGDRFRLLANEVDLVPPDAPMPRLPVGRAVWQPRPSLTTATEAWLMAGGSHHTVLSRALALEPIADFAEIAGLELLAIDAQTTVAGFARELRWNQAYYRLARGL